MDRTMETLRLMAWERAKAELNSMLCTIYEDNDHYLALKKAIKKAINEIEDAGLHD